MKKLIALLLALVLVMGLVACGNTNAPETTPAATEGTEPADTNEATEDTLPVEDTTPVVAEPNAATEIYNTIWENVSEMWENVPEDQRFSTIGGDFTAPVDNAPGNYPIDGEGLASDLYIPAEEVSKVDAISCLRHSMMANNFTGAVYHIANADDVEGFVEAMYNALSNARWLCGMPEKLVITVIDTEYVFVAFGLNNALASFEAALTAAYPEAENKYSEAIAR